MEKRKVILCFLFISREKIMQSRHDFGQIIQSHAMSLWASELNHFWSFRLPFHTKLEIMLVRSPVTTEHRKKLMHNLWGFAEHITSSRSLVLALTKTLCWTVEIFLGVYSSLFVSPVYYTSSLTPLLLLRVGLASLLCFLKPRFIHTLLFVSPSLFHMCLHLFHQLPLLNRASILSYSAPFWHQISLLYSSLPPLIFCSSLPQCNYSFSLHFFVVSPRPHSFTTHSYPALRFLVSLLHVSTPSVVPLQF